jgi:hypothetical protein
MNITIVVTRHRHSYLHTIHKDGVAGLSAEIDRARAEEIIRENNQGQLPAECNLDICQSRRWSWSCKLETDII